MKAHCIPVLCIVFTAVLAGPFAVAQVVPSELSDLVGKNHDESQKGMVSVGWEIVYSSFSGKKQYWWNEKSQTCVSMTIRGKIVDGFSPIVTRDCASRVERARKAWEGYSDGLAPAKSPSLDAAREKLASQGFRPTYRVTGLVPGKSSEYWRNEATGKCSLIVWFTKDNAYEMTVESEARQCTNPAPKKKSCCWRAGPQVRTSNGQYRGEGT